MIKLTFFFVCVICFFFISEETGMLLCDSPGMGKTITAAGFISQMQALNPTNKTLILCKKVLIGNWKCEMERWTELAIKTMPFDKNERVC